jgi:hypothetical protein
MKQRVSKHNAIVRHAAQSLIDRPANPANSVSGDLLTQPYEERPLQHFRHTDQRVAKFSEAQFDSTMACERYTVITASSHFEWINELNSVARARENLVEVLFHLNVARRIWPELPAV